MSGVFITFEGIEGSGKSTQASKLYDVLSERGLTVDLTREPGGTAIAESIREILLDPAHDRMSNTTELLLYQAARAQHVAERIRPALERGEVVICDRFFDSTTAYQGAGRGLAADELNALHDVTTGGLSPKRTYLFDLPVEEGMFRIAGTRQTDRIERESVAFHERVRQGFLALARENTERILIIDGMQDEDAIAAEVMTDIDRILDAHSSGTA